MDRKTLRAAQALITAGIMIVLGILPFGLAGCQQLQHNSVTVTATPSYPVDAIGLTGFASNVNPLTGQALADSSVLDRRPMAVKISNAPDNVRPQAGLGEADLVFEHYVEGFQTRFTAIYWTHTPPRVGSIRSARLIDLEIPAMYGTLFVYSGASDPIRQRIAALPFRPRAYEGVTVGEPLYFRDPGIEIPHNLFAIPRDVWQRATNDGVNTRPELSGMVFSDEAPAGDPAHSVTIDYGADVVRWTYDAQAQLYRRMVDSTAHTDANTGEQVTAANVVLIYAHHQPDLSIIESQFQGHIDYSTEIQIWTLGPAVVIRDGVRMSGYWNRWQEDDMLSFWLDEAATQPMFLKPGNTWFQVVPLDFTGVIFDPQ